MKIRMLTALCVGLSGVAGAITLQPETLPRCEFADTEVTTNCPFSFASPFVVDFRLAMEFDSTPSNNVQIAFGRDSDADGVLSADETGMILAWDCGEWILFGTNALPFAVSPAVDANAHKTVFWELHLKRKVPKHLLLTENGQPLFPGFTSDPEPWFYGRGWNMFRLTARGTDDPAESFAVDLNEKGGLIFLR